MKTIYFLSLLFLSAFSFGQVEMITQTCDEKVNDLFFNLDVDSSKSVLEKEISTIPDFRFHTKDKFDTIILDNGNYYTFRSSTIPGMPCFYSERTSEDQFEPDSLKIFLGGGGGIISLSHSGNFEYNLENTKSFTLETVEIIRDFNDANAATQAYESIFKTLQQLCNLNSFISETEIEGKRYWNFPISITEEEEHIYAGKMIHLDFYPPSEESKIYTVRLSYAKSIWNSDNL